MAPASHQEVLGVLGAYPAASQAWAEPLVAAQLSVRAVVTFMEAMMQHADSPMRQAEDGVLSQEIMRLSMERGVEFSGCVSTKYLVRVAAVLSAPEQTRALRIVANFCQLEFRTAKRFGKTGHAIMNVVRRACGQYQLSKLPVQCTVLEVGPDVPHWLLDEAPDSDKRSVGNYRGARPVLGPRDAVRVNWGPLVELIVEFKERYGAQVLERATKLLESEREVFLREKVQQVRGSYEYIVSLDSNYDIGFDDMPLVMAVTGARAWFGNMVRAKGLTAQTRLTEGRLDMMGVNYRVNWEKGRIDFRHPECSAFGYSHNVWEYLKYEERNGYVWHLPGVSYVYSKGPETNAELLFFSVVRVPAAPYMVEPRYAENPHVGCVEISSVWAMGDERSGVPTSFAPVKFWVDALNFSKVLEKRRQLDHKGDLAQALTFVRSTNVRFWISGVPVGASTKVESRLAEATAVAVEMMTAEMRLEANLDFGQAMKEFDKTWRETSGLMGLLESLIDMRAISGKVVGPLARAWSSLRGTVVDKALSSIKEMRVSVRTVPDHVLLGGKQHTDIEVPVARVAAGCTCVELAEVEAALSVLEDDEERMVVSKYADGLREKLPCERCVGRIDEAVVASAVKPEDESTTVEPDSGFESASEAEVLVESAWIDKDVGKPEKSSMEELVAFEQYRILAEMTELRIDAGRIFKVGDFRTARILEYCTQRTKHSVVRFFAGRCVETRGVAIGEFGAMYDPNGDKLIPVRARGSVMFAKVKDGWYYTCNRLQIWNGPQVIEAVQYALDYGKVWDMRGAYKVFLGVPGAGKTYAMMKKVAAEFAAGRTDFLVVSSTKAASIEAKEFGEKFGVPEKLLEGRVMTMDSYLINRKFPAQAVYVDEFPMVHIGKVDAIVSIARAEEASLYGDGKQIPFDTYSAEFVCKYAGLRGTVGADQVKFSGESHRSSKDVAAAWLDQYPCYYVCECCRAGEKDTTTLKFVKIKSLAEIPASADSRYHTYRQDEKEEVRPYVPTKGSFAEMKLMKNKGICTVHEDQGSTHNKVITVRSSEIFDKNASERNPSLFNKERFVLTDMTRHKSSYVYYSMCEENDLVRKRIEMSRDPIRRAMVDRKEGYGKVSVLDML